MPAPVQKGHRFLELDGLRGLAALAVVLSHFRNALQDVPHPAAAAVLHLLGSGHAAVVLFFLLSGFVLTTPYLGQRRPSYGSFLIKRVCRIYLPYVAAILLAAMLAAKLYSTMRTGDLWVDQTWGERPTTRLVLQHVAFLGHYDNTQLNTAIWTLIIEMRVSLFFPAIAWIAAKLNPWLALAACIPTTAALVGFADRRGHDLLCDTLFYAMFFLVGSLMRRYYEELHIFVNARQSWVMLLILLMALACYEGGESIPFGRMVGSGRAVADLTSWTEALGAATLLLLATAWVRLRHWLHAPAVQWAGTRSYSVYLLHGTVLFTMIRMHGSRPLPVGEIAVYLAVVLLGAELFHRSVEAPALLLGRRLSRRA